VSGGHDGGGTTTGGNKHGRRCTQYRNRATTTAGGRAQDRIHALLLPFNCWLTTCNGARIARSVCPFDEGTAANSCHPTTQPPTPTRNSSSPIHRFQIQLRQSFIEIVVPALRSWCQYTTYTKLTTFTEPRTPCKARVKWPYFNWARRSCDRLPHPILAHCILVRHGAPNHVTREHHSGVNGDHWPNVRDRP
jgi:hypothetical protein